MTLLVSVPGRPQLELEHLVLDVNGTLTNRGEMLEGIGTRIEALKRQLTIHLVSADTFGTLDAIARALGVDAVRAASGEDKLRKLERLGRQRCAVIGNGANDVLALKAAALGIVVLGPEGASPAALGGADALCTTATDALDLLVDPTALFGHAAAVGDSRERGAEDEPA